MASQISTIVRASVVTASSKTPIVTNESGHLSHAAIIGISIWVSLGLIAFALLLWITHRGNKANITRVFPEADLEATHAATTNFHNEPIEPEDSPVVYTDWSYRTSQTSSLEGPPVESTDWSYRVSQISEPEEAFVSSNRVSAITTDNDRWSAVSSLRLSWLPSTLPATARTVEVGPEATELQTFSQGDYGSGQNYYPSRQNQEGLHRFPSGRLSNM